VPLVCFLLSFAQIFWALVFVLLAACAMSRTHVENGVPRWPLMCCLLSLWHKRPYSLAWLGGAVDGFGLEVELVRVCPGALALWLWLE
jgi:hypothetical protein